MSDVRMTVEKVLFDPKVGASVVLLVDKTTERLLPIWIGQAEAIAIAMALEKLDLPRPMTHDLIADLLSQLETSVEWLRIRDLNEGTFFATLRLRRASSPSGIDLDCRPSDGIAVALRANAPIFAAERVLELAIKDGRGAPIDVDNLDEDLLENLPDDVFGKFKM